MNHYALYYFTRAVMSRPADARMWNAMANCYEKMDKKNEAAKSFKIKAHFLYSLKSNIFLAINKVSVLLSNFSI